MTDAPTPLSTSATDAARQTAAAETGGRVIQHEARAGQKTMKTVGVYERPRSAGKLSKPLMIALLVLIIMSVITFLRFLF